MDENPEEVATDTSVEVEEATDSNENSEQEDTIALQEQLEKERIAKSQILARAKKAEEELKKLKETPANPPLSSDPYFADELRLIAEGHNGLAILKAKIIAKGSGISLLDAMKDEAVVAYIKDMKALEKSEKAKLGASKGSSESHDETLIKPEMSRDEHQKAFEKLMGQVST